VRTEPEICCIQWSAAALAPVDDLIEPPHRQLGKQVRQPRAGAHADDSGHSGIDRRIVVLEHRVDRFPVVADVDVVGTGLDGGRQDRNGEPEERPGDVDDEIGGFERGPQRSNVGHVETDSACADRRRRCLGRVATKVGDDQVHIGAAGEQTQRRLRHAAPTADHHDCCHVLPPVLAPANGRLTSHRCMIDRT